MAFDKKAPTWGAPGVEPPESKKQEGWQVNDKPPAAWWNWFMNLTSEALKELQEKAAEQAWVQEQINAIDVDIQDASLTQKGIVQLSNATNGTRENVAATEKAVKAAYDEALAGKQLGVEQKANVVAALNSIGVSASTSESWAQLIPKIAAIIRATGNATAADLLAGKSASNAGGPFNGSMPNRSAENHHMPGLEATVWAGDRFFIKPPRGFFDGASWVTAAVPGLTAANLRAGVDVAGLIGTLVEGKKFMQGSVSPNANGYYVIPVNGFTPSRGFMWQGAGTGWYVGDNIFMGAMPRNADGSPNLSAESGPGVVISDSTATYIYNGFTQPNNPFFPGSIFIRTSGKITGTANYILFE